jgi:hypothetical protein
MGNFNFTAGELTSQIKRESKLNIAHLGNDSDQNTFIYYYITEALWELAAEIKKKKTSDPLIVAESGYVTFKIDGVDIEDLYAPLFIYIDTDEGKTYSTRTSFENKKGWFRQSANDRIHIRDAGTYVMQYIAYPEKVTGAGQIIDIPQTSYGLLKYKAISLIKESLNDLEGSKQANELANEKLPSLEKANKNAMRIR